VAVAAVNTQPGNVVLVAERDRLGLAHASVGNVWGTLDFHDDPAQGCNYKNRAKDGGPGQSIRTAMKNLRHSLMRSYLRRPGGSPTSASANFGDAFSDTAIKKTTHWFSELCVKLEIINISCDFVAHFWNSTQKKFPNGTLLKKC
jgi:hypothetical protein